MSAGLVIAGGGLAAQRCCELLRAAGDDRPVTILGAERERPYDRPPLSKPVSSTDPLDTTFRPAEWYAAQRIELRLGCAARALDAARHEVIVGDGERVRYGNLLIATGAYALTLPVLRGFDNVQALRTRGDAIRLRDALDAGGPLVVVGAGLIGLEAAATAAARGVEVTVVQAAARPLAGVLGPRAAAWLTARHRAAGIAVRTDSVVTGARGDGAVQELQLADGTRLPAAHVLAGVGVRPATRWLAGSGLDPAGIVVDNEGRSALPHVFAAGDAACSPDPRTGRPTPGGHWKPPRAAGARSPARCSTARPNRPRRRRSGPTSTACDSSASAIQTTPARSSATATSPPRPSSSTTSSVVGVAVVIGESTDTRLAGAALACPAGAVLLLDPETGEEVDP